MKAEIAELYEMCVRLTDVKHAEHVALQHDPIQQVVSDRVYTNCIALIRRRIEELKGE